MKLLLRCLPLLAGLLVFSGCGDRSLGVFVPKCKGKASPGCFELDDYFSPPDRGARSRKGDSLATGISGTSSSYVYAKKKAKRRKGKKRKPSRYQQYNFGFYTVPSEKGLEGKKIQVVRVKPLRPTPYTRVRFWLIPVKVRGRDTGCGMGGSYGRVRCRWVRPLEGAKLRLRRGYSWQVVASLYIPRYAKGKKRGGHRVTLGPWEIAGVDIDYLVDDSDRVYSDRVMMLANVAAAQLWRPRKKRRSRPARRRPAAPQALPWRTGSNIF